MIDEADEATEVEAVVVVVVDVDILAWFTPDIPINPIKINIKP